MLDRIDHDHGIRELHLARPPANALNPELVQALRNAIDSAPTDGVSGLILSGAPGLFSGGLDVPSLIQLDRDQMERFWRQFFALCAELARSPLPIVAAIGGHSPAGGAVLTLFCDYRIMAHGPFQIGLNEVQVGLVAPECIQLAMRRLIGAYPAERLLVSGKMLDAESAHRIGLVDELVGVDDVVTRAKVWLGELLALPRHAMLATRRIARADLAAAFADLDALPVDDFLDGWFSDHAQQVLRALVARLKGGGGEAPGHRTQGTP
ncbi:MAG TPA: enoyl-CoA hydratase/isomerase family protein [Rhodanobacteraceae bacterium]|nr:enoyl-CoA hydratase/isomerase family protein [Rhodanobacteraceae bacterium]